MNTINYDRLFPSLVTYCDKPELINDNVVIKAKEILRENQEKPFYSQCISTVNKELHILDLPEFKNIRVFIVDLIQAYCDLQKFKSLEMMFQSSWLNLYNVHGYQDLHTHHDSMLSGVFYLKSSGEKDLIFQAPWHFFQACFPEYTESTLENCHNVEYESVIGRCYIFPSHLMHRTLPAKSERISLSFNVQYARP